MASNKSREFLRANGIVLSHSELECSNFATGAGHGKLSSPYHVVATGGRLGTSKRSVGWARTMDDAETQAGAERMRLRALESGRCRSGGGAEFKSDAENRQYVYIIDIRNNQQSINMGRLGFNF